MRLPLVGWQPHFGRILLPLEPAIDPVPAPGMCMIVAGVIIVIAIGAGGNNHGRSNPYPTGAEVAITPMSAMRLGVTKTEQTKHQCQSEHPSFLFHGCTIYCHMDRRKAAWFKQPECSNAKICLRLFGRNRIGAWRRRGRWNYHDCLPLFQMLLEGGSLRDDRLKVLVAAKAILML